MGEEETTPLIGQLQEYGSSFFGNDAQREEEPPAPTSFWGKVRKVAHENVEGTIDSPLEYTILLLIFLNVVLLAASTLLVDNKCFGSKCERFGDKYETFFEYAEAISVVIFTFEYVLRIWTCVEFEEVAAKGGFWGRLGYATTFFPLIDLLSIAPYWIAMALGGESPDFITAIRCFRLVRLLKADKYLNAFEYVFRFISAITLILTDFIL